MVSANVSSASAITSRVTRGARHVDGEGIEGALRAWDADMGFIVALEDPITQARIVVN